MSVIKRLAYNRGFRTRRSSRSYSSVSIGSASKESRIELEGADELIDLIDQIIAEEGGAKSINAALRKATRKACKEIVLPAAKDLVPVDSGFLEDQLTVRAAKGRRGKVGHSVGFRDPLFKGDTYYGGFLEFGFKHRHGVGVPGEKFLRYALYDNESRVEQLVRSEMAQWVQQRNREA